MSSKDEKFTVAAFAERGTSRFFGNAADSQPLRTLDAYSAFARIVPGAAKIWLQRLSTVTESAIWSIIERVPPDRMPAVSKDFTLKLLMINRQRLRELEDV
jgi:hypothetical protein